MQFENLRQKNNKVCSIINRDAAESDEQRNDRRMLKTSQEMKRNAVRKFETEEQQEKNHRRISKVGERRPKRREATSHAWTSLQSYASSARRRKREEDKTKFQVKKIWHDAQLDD
ncbi:hypothetical protein AAHA92_28703 [Salvia divinorum]|uniref:Uncharacterized protein n=1 Tax=Salvia divinorum TaxID=28513 RepID=A0ABD1FYF9_SALDI